MEYEFRKSQPTDKVAQLSLNRGMPLYKLDGWTNQNCKNKNEKKPREDGEKYGRDLGIFEVYRGKDG